MKKTSRVSSAIIFLILCAPLAAERFVIRSVRFESDGRTRQYYLEKAAEIEAERGFDDRVALEAYVADRRQVLLNERVLESVDIEIVTAVPEGDSIAVDLIIRTKDTWNIVALPYVRYDSNTGLLLAGRGRDYDFLGTMEPLYLNLNWQFDEDWKSEPGVELRFSAPFPLGGRELILGFEAAAALPEELPLALTLAATAGMEVPLGVLALKLSGTQTFEAGGVGSGAIPYTDPWYFRSSIAAAVGVPLLSLGRLGKLIFTPSVSLGDEWKPGGLSDPRFEAGPWLIPKASLAFGRVDWMGNLRKGLKGETSFSWGFDITDGSFVRRFNGAFSLFTSGGRLGFSVRASGFLRLDSAESSVADPIRGVMNYRLSTDAAVFLNADFPISLIRFRPAVWFNQPWMRWFQFEQLWSPFIDIALAHDPTTGRLLDPRDGWYGSGLEIITFPEAARSFYIRISAGWDLRDVVALRSLSGTSPRDGGPIREFFMGMGHHY